MQPGHSLTLSEVTSARRRFLAIETEDLFMPFPLLILFKQAGKPGKESVACIQIQKTGLQGPRIRLQMFRYADAASPPSPITGSPLVGADHYLLIIRQGSDQRDGKDFRHVIYRHHVAPPDHIHADPVDDQF